MFHQAIIQEQSVAEEYDISSHSGEKQMHILVVDDEPDIRRVVSHCLEQSGYDVSTAASAEEAYCLISNFEYDVIMTDVMMPGEDGLSFLAKTHQILPDVPIIVMTGFAQLQMAVNAIKNGAFDFIHKPFDFVYLRKVMQKAVSYASLRNMEKNYRVKLEDAVARRTFELKHALTQLEATRTTLLKVAREKDKFMTMIIQEMRTPMHGVIGALDLLADAGLSGPQREYLCLARQSADNMVALVDRGLSCSNGFDNSPTVFHDILDLSSAIEPVAEVHRPPDSHAV